MSAYVRKLAALDRAGCLLTPARSRILLLTGQSSFRSSALSLDQLAFLDAVAPAGAVIVRAGFPYHSAFLPEKWQEPGILAASFRNTRQVLWTLARGDFRRAIARRLQTAIDATSERLILITGSCGLQMANCCWADLTLPARLKIDVIALGPVCFGVSRINYSVMLTLHDVWSRMLYRGPVHAQCAGGHLDYWKSPEVRATVKEWFR